MLFSFDAIVASLILVLPGFLVIGTVVAFAPSWERFNPNPASYILLSLGCSIPLQLGFAWLSTRDWLPRVRPWFRAFGTFDFTKLTGLAFTVSFLKPLTTLLVLSAALGLAIVGAMHLWQLVKRLAGKSSSVSRKTVWRQLFDTSAHAPFVLVLIEGRAYLGEPTCVTTTSADPDVFLERVSVMPIDQVSGKPDWTQLAELNMKGLLLPRDEIREMWFLKENPKHVQDGA